jgi:hypothetical protein
MDPVVGEDKKWVLNPLLIALPKRGMSLLFWMMLLDKETVCGGVEGGAWPIPGVVHANRQTNHHKMRCMRQNIGAF